MKEIIAILEKVALVLAPIPTKIVFTGGATIPLYLDDASISDIRPTDDVDCVVEVSSRIEYYKLSDSLRNLGLSESSVQGDPLCRWRYENIKIDIMPTDESVIGFSNSWYPAGMKHSIYYYLPNGIGINIFSSPYLLATKIEAFKLLLR